MLSDRIKKALQGCAVAAAAIVAMTFTAQADLTVDLADYGIQSGQDITDVFNMVAERKDNSETGRVQRREDGEDVPYEPGTLTIVIPAGTYNVGGGTYDQLRVWGNTTVSMEGVTLVRAGKASMLRFGSKDLDWDSYNGGQGRPGYSPDFSDISFVGGTWDGGAMNRSIMQMGHASDLMFDDVTFTNVGQAHYLEFGGCQNIQITNCTFSDYKGSFSNSYNGEAVQFEILSSTGNEHFDGYNPIDDETICRNVEITGCTFQNLKRGVGTHTAIANSYFENFQIHDNTFKNITGYAISMMNYKNSFVLNNMIDGCGCGIQVSASERSHKNFYPSKNAAQNSRKNPEKLNIQISQNTLVINSGANGSNYNNNNFGIWVFGEKLKSNNGSMPAGDWRASGVTVTNNTITLNASGGSAAIWLTGTKDCTVSDNNITVHLTQKGKGKGQEAGIRLEDSEADTVSGNTVKNKTKLKLGKNMIGIQVRKAENENSSKKAHIKNNVIKNAAIYGIKAESASGITIQGNTIQNTGTSSTKGDGIKIGDISSASIGGNTIKKSSRDGIKVDDSYKIMITANKIESCGRYGIMAPKRSIKKESGNKFAGGMRKKQNIT